MDIEDKKILENCISVRENIVSAMTVKGIPDDVDDRAFLLNALNGLEKVALTRARLKNEDKANDISNNANAIVASLLTRLPSLSGDLVEGVTVPVIDGNIMSISLAPGENKIGVESFDYEQMVNE